MYSLHHAVFTSYHNADDHFAANAGARRRRIRKLRRKTVNAAPPV